MGLVPLSTWRTDLKESLGRPALTDTRLDGWVNDSLREVGYAFKFPDLEATATFVTVAGQYEYPIATIAADYRMLHDEGLWIQSPVEKQKKLKKETRTQWVQKINDLTDTLKRATPSHYHRFTRKIVLRPIPDDVVTVLVHYWKKITPLIAPTDVSPLLDEWDEIIYLGALYRGYRHYREFDRYLDVRNDFLGLVRSRSDEEDVEEFAQGGIEIASTAAETNEGTSDG